MPGYMSQTVGSNIKRVRPMGDKENDSAIAGIHQRQLLSPDTHHPLVYKQPQGRVGGWAAPTQAFF